MNGKISNDFNCSSVRPETSKDERRVFQQNLISMLDGGILAQCPI